MKKLLPLLLALVLCFSLVCVCVYADEDEDAAVAEITNYLQKEWEKGSMGMAAVDKVTDPDGDYFDCTYSAPASDGDIQNYHSPIVDVYDAVKAAVGDEDEAEIVFVFEVRCTWQDGSDASDASGRVLLRGVNAGNHATSNGESDESEWNDAWGAYVEDAELDDSLFKDTSGNIMYISLGNTNFNADEWTPFVSSPMTVNKGHLNDEFFKGWNLCIDQMGGEFESLKSIQLRNTGVYLADEYEEPEPEETPTPEPVETPKPTNTPVPETAAPTAEATEAPAEDNGGPALSTPALIAIIAGAAVVAAAVVVVIVVKKKQS